MGLEIEFFGNCIWISWNLYLEILVIGSIFSTQPILTSGIQRAQLTWAQSFPVLVAFMAPPLLGHSSHFGVMFKEHVRQNLNKMLTIVYQFHKFFKKYYYKYFLPRSGWDTSNAITSLVNANFAFVTEYHFVIFLLIRLQKR